MTNTATSKALQLDERERRLPKWVQDELTQLRRDNERLRDQAEEARLAASPDESDTVIDRVLRGGEIGLGKRPRVVFRTRTGEISAQVERDGILRVSADMGGIVVEPRASNAVFVHARER
jgi:hypothetical protein